MNNKFHNVDHGPQVDKTKSIKVSFYCLNHSY